METFIKIKNIYIYTYVRDIRKMKKDERAAKMTKT